jgi:hypothetical protein
MIGYLNEGGRGALLREAGATQWLNRVIGSQDHLGQAAIAGAAKPEKAKSSRCDVIFGGLLTRERAWVVLFSCSQSPTHCHSNLAHLRTTTANLTDLRNVTRHPMS